MPTANDYPIELTAPDISRYRAGNAGVDFVTRLDSGRDGPHVLVTAIVHGNELCGAIALDDLLTQAFRPRHGRLTLAFVNVAAYHSFDKANPTASRYVDEDFNRLWSPEVLDSTRKSVELARARQLRPIVEQADFLLDIHSMQHATPPLMLCGPLEKGRRLAREVGGPAIIVSDRGHDAGRRLRDFGGFGDPASAKNALLIECGQHWARSSSAVAREVLLRFLARFDMIDLAATAPDLAAARPTPQPLIEVTEAVTIRSDAFRFLAEFRGLETIAKAGTVIARDGEQPVATPYDDCVLIMPSRRLNKGQTAVRLGRYV